MVILEVPEGPLVQDVSYAYEELTYGMRKVLNHTAWAIITKVTLGTFSTTTSATMTTMSLGWTCGTMLGPIRLWTEATIADWDVTKK